MGKQEWLVILPDKPNSLSARMAVRPKHLEAVKPHVDAGSLVLGGATLDEKIKDGEGLKINGSIMIYEAESVDEVMEVVESDIYYREGVWDPAKIQVIPFKSAIRTSLK